MSTKVILLHGAIGAADQLLPLKTELEKRGASCFPFEFSGHGKTPVSQTGFGIQYFATELKEFILINNLQQAHVFGYSMGGYVALYLMAAEINLLGNIATLGTKFDWNLETALKESKMLNPEQIELKVPKFAESLAVRHGAANWKELLARTAKMMIDLGNHNLLSAEKLKSIENKVMLGLADNDNMVSYDETKHVFNQLKSKQFYMLPNTKHPIESVNVDLLSHLLLDFYKS
ncbi:MAG: alpha/beta fold hydrolase [Bacteroidetes bacterium]|nr:alpha/beta fold hydrolase [Bacteroidota bacterium]